MTIEDLYNKKIAIKVQAAQLALEALSNPEDDETFEEATEMLGHSVKGLIECGAKMSSIGMEVPADAQNIISGIIEFTPAEPEEE